MRRILFVQQEWPTWKQSRHWAYAAHLGVVDGLRANQVDVVILASPWLDQAHQALAGQRFDQVWFNDLVHLEAKDAVLQSLAELAPVRVGLLVESLTYYADEYAVAEILKEQRKKEVLRRLQYVTHVVACDEADETDLNERSLAPTIWAPFAVPERFICEAPGDAAGEHAVYCGALYGSRSQWLAQPALQGILVRQPSPENRTPLPRLFGLLHSLQSGLLRRLPAKAAMPLYVASLHSLRQRMCTLWLAGMRTGQAVVNLPHFVKTYTPRVIEAMAAGRPAVSWEIPERPRNRALFDDGEEILLYPKDDPGGLAEQVRRVLSDAPLRERLVVNARRKLRRHHTSERRVRQILDWIDDGQVPTYE